MQNRKRARFAERLAHLLEKLCATRGTGLDESKLAPASALARETEIPAVAFDIAERL